MKKDLIILPYYLVLTMKGAAVTVGKLSLHLSMHHIGEKR
jgi:hypothetical protein